MTSLNFELRREIYQKSKVINERDEEIKRLIKSKTEAEILLREVKEKLSEAYKEKQLLKLELAQMKEDKRSRRERREWSSGLSAGLWVGRPGFESWPRHYVVALSKPLHSPCFVFSDKTLSRRSRLLQGLG